jgi:hypothetical protein
MGYGISDFEYRVNAVDPNGKPFERCFSSQMQADEFASQLKKEGYTSVQVTW